MIDRHDDLASWEKWPLAALFLANALNVFILYVPQEEMPLSVQWLLPWARVFCGLAAAASLEGTLIAVTMGRRLGRDSRWSWAAMFAASAFTALVAYYVHAQVGLAAAGLFMAQAVVLFIYTQHLAQPRKPLQIGENTDARRLRPAILAQKRLTVADRVTVPATDGFKCKICDHVSETLADASRHARRSHPKESASPADYRDLPQAGPQTEIQE
jgi:hypothetical protein